MQTHLLAGAFFCIGLLLAGCAGVAPRTDYSTLGIAAALELNETPFFPQSQYQCGPAALAMTLNAAGAQTTPETLRPLVYLPERKGSLQPEMLAAPARYGLLGVPLRPSFATLLQALDAGHAVLVLQNFGLKAWPVWHYAVAIGYDLDARRLMLRSGTERSVNYRFEVFLKTWSRAGHWAMVVVPPAQVPRGVSAQAFLTAVTALERVGRHAGAGRAYRAAAARWPDNALAWAGAGNSAYALGRFGDAEQAYRAALGLSPGDLPLMNNLALALAARGCREQARALIGCALRRAPGDAVLEATAAEILDFAAGSQTCEPVVCAAPGQ